MDWTIILFTAAIRIVDDGIWSEGTKSPVGSPTRQGEAVQPEIITIMGVA